jgi:hypothetical protein
MADNDETQTSMLSALGSVSRSSVDGSTNTNVATTAAPDPVIDYAAQGGAVTTSENKKHSLMSLFKALDRDVYYAMKDVGLNEVGGPYVLSALVQIFPGINQQEFLDTYKSASIGKKLRLPDFSFLHRTERIEHGTKWIMVKSRPELVPIKSPRDQIAAVDIKAFWPYEGGVHSSPNVRRRATFEACNAQFNHNSDTAAAGDNTMKSASLPTSATTGVTKALKAGKVSSTGSPRRKNTKVSSTTTVEAAKLLSSLTSLALHKKTKASSLKAAPTTTKGAATSTTTKAAAKLSTATSGSPRSKKAKVATQPLTTNAAAATAVTMPPLEETPAWKAYVTWLDQGQNSVQQVQFTKCPGFRRDLIEGCAGIESEKKKKIMTGFSHLCGEGLHNFAARISGNDKIDSKWPIVGALRSSKTKNEDGYMWMVSMLEPYDDRTFTIHSVKCVGERGDKKIPWPICEECTKSKRSFFERCRKAVDIRAGL